MMKNSIRFELRNVTHTYPNGEAVLRNINLTIGAGERVALIGESGAGKSTLKSLLQRDFNPSKGTVYINGRDYARQNLSHVKRYLASIEQDSVTMSGTVKENMLYGLSDQRRNTVTDEEIIGVIQAISGRLWQRFAEKGGLGAEVGRYGMELSGGERQRLLIARAILKRPKVLLLDEVTSAQDPKTEAEVQDGIDEVMKMGVTAVVIAHKFATLRQCTKFVCLKMPHECAPNEPQIEAVTNDFEGLYKVSPTFRDLYDRQRMSF